MDHFYKNSSFGADQDWFDYQGLYKRMVQKFDNAHFVEIGSWKGRSSVFLAVEIINAGKNIKLDCIDTWEGSIEHATLPEVIDKTLYTIFLKNIEPVKHIINPIKCKSLDACNSYPTGSLDFVFIDASHEYVDVWDDIIHWLPKVKKGGVLAGHDIYFPGVGQALKELLFGQYTVEGNCYIHQKV